MAETLKEKRKELIKVIQSKEWDTFDNYHMAAIEQVIDQILFTILEEVKRIDQELENEAIKIGASKEYLQTVGVWRSNFMHKLNLLSTLQEEEENE